MAKFFSKINIPTATEHFSTFNLDCNHITTQDFFKLKPIYIRPLVPKQSIKVDVSSITRLAPLFKPMYGDVKIVNRAFFVPYRLLMEGFNQFINDTPYQDGKSTVMITSMPYTTPFHILRLLSNTGYSNVVTTGTYDFTYANKNYQLTNKGRFVYDILMTLGYQVINQPASTANNMKLNAMPLLAFAKIYMDWYQPSNFAPSYSVEQYLKGVNKVIDNAALNDIFSNILYCSREPDYFTSAWQNPNSPYNTTMSQFNLNDISLSPSGLGADQMTYISNINNNNSSNQMPAVLRNVTDNNVQINITKYGLQTLTALSDYLKRHQLSGYRAIDRFKARFGIVMKSEEINRSLYLGKSVTPVNVTDVTSTSDTDGAVLGQYSGFGIAKSNNGSFNFRSEDEYGLFIILSTISPGQTQYRNGIDRFNLDITKLDLYTPEFDGLGCQAIANAELYAQGLQSETEGVFGYTPRYAHYKVANDRLSGDFRINTGSASLESFHLFRNLTEIPMLNKNFVIGNNTEYDRIFNSTSSEGLTFDHFISMYHFKVTTKAPMSPLFENYHFDEEGKIVESKVGGTTLT